MKITDLKPEDVGRGVVYCPAHGSADDGVIVRWNESYVFVRYRKNETPQATRPEDLEFLRG